jgi:hypothetical protein
LLAIPLIGLVHLSYGASVNEYELFLQQFILCLLSYFIFFKFTSIVNNKLGEAAILVILLLPGVVHLAIFFVDIFSKYDSFSNILANMENIKDIPRVGRKYLSIGLSLFLVSAFIGSARSSGKIKLLLLFSILPTSIALAVLDTRAAFIALILVIVTVIVIPVFRRSLGRALTEISDRKFILLAYIVVVLAVSVFASYESGKTRWSFLMTSLSSGIQAVKATKVDSPTKKNIEPWRSKNYWNSNCDGPTGQFRCGTDSSAYLRSSWMVYGLKGVREHPMGTAFDREPLRALYIHDHPNEDTGDLALADSHSQLLDEALSFGVIGIVFYAIFFLNLIKMGYEKIQANSYSPVYFGLYLVLGSCMTRFALDNFKEGLGYYLMSIVGMFVALTLSNKSSIQPEVVRKGWLHR